MPAPGVKIVRKNGGFKTESEEITTILRLQSRGFFNLPIYQSTNLRILFHGNSDRFLLYHLPRTVRILRLDVERP
jgi:hypothetical protein